MPQPSTIQSLYFFVKPVNHTLLIEKAALFGLRPLPKSLPLTLRVEALTPASFHVSASVEIDKVRFLS